MNSKFKNGLKKAEDRVLEIAISLGSQFEM
jgi:hypothetical protein